MSRWTILVILAALLFSPAFAKGSEIPPGFREHKIRPGDLLGKIAPREHWDLIQRVNRIDERHLVPGKKLLVPQDIKLAKAWVPVPESLTREGPPRIVCVYLDKQYFGIYESGRLIYWGPISSGTEDYETPRGEFTVLRKSRDYYSKRYDAAMPYAVFISRDGYAFHEQALPGRPASHGCLRLLEKDAQKLFEWSKKGDLVTIK